MVEWRDVVYIYREFQCGFLRTGGEFVFVMTGLIRPMRFICVG